MVPSKNMPQPINSWPEMEETSDAQEVKTILGGFVMKDALQQMEVVPTSVGTYDSLW